MASFKQTIAFEKGATFIFGSCVCIADDIGSFQRHLVPDEEKKVSTSTVDDLIENFGEITLSDIVRGHEFESESLSTSTQSRVGPFEPDSISSSNLKIHPTQPMGFRNSATVYQEALRRKFESITDKNENFLVRVGDGHAIACQEATLIPNYYLDSDDETPLSGYAGPSGKIHSRIYWKRHKPTELKTPVLLE
ncbi:unnamed protein product [Urochloa humidicola]